MTPEEFQKSISKVTNPLPGSTPQSVNYKLTVKKKYEGLNIVDFYLKNVHRTTPEIWLNKINAGNLKVNSNIIDQDYSVVAGDITEHTSDPKIEPEVDTNIQLIYNDADIIVINKPSPLPVHASGRFMRNTLISILKLAFPKEELKLLHRLDANTTGIIVLAKNKVVANAIKLQFESKIIKKTYIALVEGIVKDDFINLEASIGKEVLVGGAREIDVNGKVSKTEIEVLERRIEENQTLLKVTPSTGRTNQIRLHLANLNHPIVGDLGYKDQDYFKTNPFTYATDSLFLHAQQLEIIHPTSKATIIFKAELPEKFTCKLI